MRKQILENKASDFIVISETHCRDNNENQPELLGYKWVGHCRSHQHIRANKRNGGVGLFVKESQLKVYNMTVVDSSIDGILAILFQHKVSNFMFIIYSCYLPPENSPWGRDADGYFGHLLSLIYYHNYVDCHFICGDLNSKTGALNDAIDEIDTVPQRLPCDPHSKNKHGECFIDFLIESKFCITNGRVTPEFNDYTCVSSKGKSSVDYFAVPIDCVNRCIKCEVSATSDVISSLSLQSLISTNCRPPDHSLLTLTYNIMHPDLDPQPTHQTTEGSATQNATAGRKRYDLDRISSDFMSTPMWGHVCQSLISRIERMEINQNSCDSLYDLMVKDVFIEMDKHIDYRNQSKRSRKLFKNSKPYWSENLNELWKDMVKSEKCFRKCVKSSKHRSHLYNSFKHKQQVFDKALRNAERAHNRKLADEIEEVNTSDPNKFWDYIKKLGPSKSSEIPLKVYNESGVLVDDINSVLDKWQKDFYELYNVPESSDLGFDDKFLHDILQEKALYELADDSQSSDLGFNAPFTQEELHKISNKLKSGKAVGPDLLPNEILKHVGLRLILLKFINMCFEMNVIPSIWRTAKISPIPKSSSKDPFVPLNYRGISLLSCVYKIYSGLLNARLMSHCERNNLLVDEQNGFRADRSCIEHIFTASSVIKNRMSDNLPTFCAYIDMKKAFDWVNRDMLLFKLHTQFGIKGRLYDAIKSIYRDSSACVKLRNAETEYFSISSGVKQGDNLSPTLFSMYLNDLALEIKSKDCGININGLDLCILLYADDIILLAPTEQKLQIMLDTIANWCKKWRMQVNKDKTQIVHYRKSGVKCTESKFKFNRDELEIVPSYKYLGVFLDEHMTFLQTAQSLSKAATRALGLLRYKLRFLKDCRCASFTTMYSSYICPILDYSSGVWGTKTFQCIEQVQRAATRYFLGVHKFAPTEMLQGDVGWLPCFARHKISILRLWNRLVTMPSTRLTSHIFFWDLGYQNRNTNWSSRVHSIFQEIGCVDIFDNMEPIDLKIVYERLFEIESNNFDIRRYTKPKLRYYNMFKGDMYQEDYLKLNISKYQRSIFAQFRAGILPLQVEIGRYRNIPLEERLCTLCDACEVEDEFHFLLKCSRYEDLRKSLFEKALLSETSFLNLQDFEKFVYLNNNCQKDTIIFLQKAMRIRSTCLYRM